MLLVEKVYALVTSKKKQLKLLSWKLFISLKGLTTCRINIRNKKYITFTTIEPLQKIKWGDKDEY